MYYEAAVVWQVGGIMLCGAVVGFDEKVATLQLLLFFVEKYLTALVFLYLIAGGI